MIKILQNGIKHDNGYTPCFYRMGNNTRHSEKCITIYARDSDKVYLEPGDKYYDEALAAYNKRRLADSKRFLKHDEKRLQKELDSGCPYEATVRCLEDSIANYKRIIEALSA